MPLARFDLDGGGTVLVEVDLPGGPAPAGRGEEVLHAASKTLERTLRPVRDAAAAALGQFQSMARRPDEVEIKFGIKLDAEAGAVIAKTGVHGQFDVKLVWRAGTPDRTDGSVPALPPASGAPPQPR
ncbi:CU044_2847 family protein [Gandjariella thermophila]|uniref:Trypsin-co-occurring domain-containing protein n=1 Tax=Gandjariella thermophila TaxID=1931992 RepID=A0A4D4JBE7_9PSEU|nr:CU044_2847 family protein [Gandjariella thermophila]GDY32662.1 hypothetical protein GTS_42950 [Gandjariella thermophila]